MPKPKSDKSDWERLKHQTDADIAKAVSEDEDTFIPDTGFWENAEIVLPQSKQQITLKLDPKIIDFFKKQGRGYNTRINAVLKSYVEQMEQRG